MTTKIPCTIVEFLPTEAVVHMICAGHEVPRVSFPLKELDGYQVGERFYWNGEIGTDSLIRKIIPIHCHCSCHNSTSIEECRCCEGMCSECRKCFVEGLDEHCKECGGIGCVNLDLLDRLHDHIKKQIEEDGPWEEYTGDG